MDTQKFTAEYPSAKFKDGEVTLSQEDYDKLHVAIGTAAPENVKTFIYEGFNVVVDTKTAVVAEG